MKYICAHCGGFSRFEDLNDLLDDGQVLKCEHCCKETIIDLNKPTFRKELYALYTMARRSRVETTTETLPAQYKVENLEIGVEAWRGNWSLYVKHKGETMWFRDPAPNEEMARARAALLANMIREGALVGWVE